MIDIRFEKSVYQQVEALLGSNIESGVLSHRSLLPSVQALAEQYQKSVFTIQSALNLLSNDGLIERTRGRGTFITSKRKTLKNVGIYFGADTHGLGVFACHALPSSLLELVVSVCRYTSFIPDADRVVKRRLAITGLNIFQ